MDGDDGGGGPGGGAGAAGADVAPHHELVFGIRLLAHAQPAAYAHHEQDATAETATRFSFQAARREGIAMFAAIQRLLERHGYKLGAESNVTHHAATLAPGTRSAIGEAE